MRIDDAQFDELLTAALYRADELDYYDMPSDEELEQLVQPSPRFQRKMKSLLRDPNRYIRSRRLPIYVKVMRSAAAVFIVLTLLLGSAMAVSPTVRAAVVNFVRTWFEDRTVYQTPDHVLDKEWTFGFIPEGFKLIDAIETELHLLYIYQNDHALILSITVSREKQVVDNEHSVFSQTVLSGRSADIYESIDPQYPSIIVIFDELSGVFITLVSEIDVGELIRIAENIE